MNESCPLHIVVSYRREDAAGHAGRLHADLGERFGEDCVFLDITIEPGEEWDEAIEREIGSADVFITVIGRQWLTVKDAGGRRRLDDPDDVLRLEVEAALQRTTRVIPVLVQDAKMPPSEELPEGIRNLVRRQAHELSDTRWDYDVGTLVKAIDAIARRKQEAIAREATVTQPQPQPQPQSQPQPQQEQPPTTTAAATAAPAVGTSRRERQPRSARRRWLALGAAAAAVGVVGVVVAVLLVGGGTSDGWSVFDTASAELEAPPPKLLSGATAESGSDEAVAVGVSGGRPAVWSYLGTALSSQTLPGSGVLNAVAASGGNVVAVGWINSGGADRVNGMIWRRSGENTWARTCPPDVCGGSGKQEILAVAALPNNRFIAVGRVTVVGASGANFDAAVWLSDDGRTWTSEATNDDDLQGDLNQVMKGVLEVDGRLVAVGRNGLEGSAWTSDDGGRDWTLVSAQAFQPEGRDIELEAVAILDSRLVAVGRETNSADADRAAAWFSDDGGTRWTRATVLDARFLDQQMIDVVAVQDGLVAVGNDDSHAAVWQSPDGVEWIPVSSDSFDGASGMKGLAQLSTGEIVAVGVASGDGRIWVSEPDQ